MLPKEQKVKGMAPPAYTNYQSTRYTRPMFQLHVHPQARAWVPSKNDLSKLGSYFKNPDMNVHIWPRSMAEQILGRKTKPYAFRAFTRGKDSHLFVDPTETPESIAWLMGHELTHQLIDKSPTVAQAFSDARAFDADPVGDTFHDIDPEERFCDGIATRLLGYRLDRAWWRKRTPKG